LVLTLSIEVGLQVGRRDSTVHSGARNDLFGRELDDTAHIHGADNLLVAISGQVIGNHGRPERPSHDNRLLDTRPGNDGSQIIGPMPSIAVSIGILRLAGNTMPPHVIRDQSVMLQRRTADLLFPAQMTAQQAVNEDNGWAVWISSFLYCDGYTIRSSHGIGFRSGLHQYGSPHKNNRNQPALPVFEGL